MKQLASCNDSIEWAAGLFEGEGSIFTYLQPRAVTPVLRLQVKMTDEDVVLRFAAAVECGVVFGPYCYQQPDGHVRKPFWMWRVDAGEAARLLRRMYPMLGERRRARAEPFLAQETFDLVGV